MVSPGHAQKIVQSHIVQTKFGNVNVTVFHFNRLLPNPSLVLLMNSLHGSVFFLLQSSTSFNRDAVKAGTGRRFLGGLLNDTSYCYTLEVSFYSYILDGPTTAVPYTEEACILLKSFLLLQHT